jgi:ABC-type polysaccharide/polyol phosphate transport system ATPase subunit
VSEPAIELAGVGKRYTKYEDTPMLVTRALRFRTRTRRSKLWALRDVDIEVARGECLGVIGRNGSGKSTMLGLLAGVTGPTEGRVTVRGRVAPLISVGVGFHPELTGRENVYVNGSVLGMTRPEVDQHFDEILDFAEVAAFIDTPVKFYSTGMQVRLGFSVAVAAQPEILLVDEVLAVGDLAFQMKCYKRMTEIRESGATVVMVSHNLAAIRNLCPRTVVMHYGEKRHDGDTNEAIRLFHDLLGEQRELDDQTAQPGTERVNLGARIQTVQLLGPDGEPTSYVHADDEVTVRAHVVFDRTVEDPVFGLAVSTESGVFVYVESTPFVGVGRFAAGSEAVFKARFPAALPTGPYLVQLSMRSVQEAAVLARAHDPLRVYVSGRDRVHGLADLHAVMQVEAVDSAESA